MGATGRSVGLEQARAKMAAAGVDPVAIDNFCHYYRLLEHGETGMIPESSIDPVDIESLAAAEVDERGAASYRFYLEGTSAPALVAAPAVEPGGIVFTGGLGLVL